MLYWLVTAMYPQFLITLDENDEEQDVTVRVGQAVNTIGLAGTRSGISGVSVFVFSFPHLVGGWERYTLIPSRSGPTTCPSLRDRPSSISSTSSYTSSFTNPLPIQSQSLLLITLPNQSRLTCANSLSVPDPPNSRPSRYRRPS